MARIRARRDQQVERTKSVLDRVPPRLLGPIMRLISYLIYDLDLDLSRFGIVKDEFGTAMVSNVGTFGIRAAFGPIVPFSRTPMVVLMGKVEDRVVAENGRPVVRPMMTLCVTLDHRFMDGYHGGEMARICCEFLRIRKRDAVAPPKAFAVVGGARLTVRRLRAQPTKLNCRPAPAPSRRYDASHRRARGARPDDSTAPTPAASSSRRTARRMSRKRCSPSPSPRRGRRVAGCARRTPSRPRVPTR